MAFQVSPGVLVQELDLTRVIPAVSTSIGAFAGEFRQGPVDEIVTVSSEQQLTEQFGKPDANNFEDYFSAANFLQYTNNLKVVRVTNSGLLNASTDGTGTLITFEAKSTSSTVIVVSPTAPAPFTEFPEANSCE